MTSSKSVEQRLVAAATKSKREQEAIRAMRDYQSEKTRVDANTLRLRALRLAKEEADAQAAPPPAAPKKKPVRAAKKVKTDA